MLCIPQFYVRCAKVLTYTNLIYYLLTCNIVVFAKCCSKYSITYKIINYKNVYE